jgi:alpha-tubulin suppressor-like RCC1 family protein
MEFTTGDVVQLASGGPKMTVQRIVDRDPNYPYFDCSHFYRRIKGKIMTRLQTYLILLSILSTLAIAGERDRMVNGKIGRMDRWIAAGSNHSVYIGSDYAEACIYEEFDLNSVLPHFTDAFDGYVFAVGKNDLLQLGRGPGGPASSRFWQNVMMKEECSNSAQAPRKLDSTIAVAAGDDFSLALRSDGTVWAWGTNNYGQLGHADFAASDGYAHKVRFNNCSAIAGTPMLVLDKIIAIAAGKHHALALASDGTLWAWGDNSMKQLGANCNGTPPTMSNIPLKVTVPNSVITNINMQMVVAIGCGDDFSLAILSDGTVYAWGDNSNGQLGAGDLGPHDCPALVQRDSAWATGSLPVPLRNVVTVEGGSKHAVAVTASGEAYAWGDNSSGQLAVTTIQYSAYATQMKEGNENYHGKVIAASAAEGSTLLLLADGAMLSVGSNAYGQLGRQVQGSSTPYAGRVGQSLGAGVTITSGKRYYSVVVDDAVFMWGDNSSSQMACDVPTTATLPVFANATFCHANTINMGSTHGFVLNRCMTMGTWGHDWHGMAGSNKHSVLIEEYVRLPLIQEKMEFAMI